MSESININTNCSCVYFFHFLAAVNTCELFVGGLKNMTKEMAEEKVKSLFPEAADIDIKMERTGARQYVYF